MVEKDDLTNDNGENNPETGDKNEQKEGEVFEMRLNVKIPDERVGVLIGKNGSVKKYIQEETGTIIDIDTTGDTGSVTVKAAPGSSDPVMVWVARDIVRAIGRGFNEEKACKLLDENYRFDLIRIGDLASPKRLKQIKGRLIGQKGKMRTAIEESTDVFISIYGKTVSIIGRIENIDTAKRAIDMILEGRQLGTVFKFLEMNQTRRKRTSRILWDLS